jgi:hypothetical protein
LGWRWDCVKTVWAPTQSGFNLACLIFSLSELTKKLGFTGSDLDHLPVAYSWVHCKDLATSEAHILYLLNHLNEFCREKYGLTDTASWYDRDGMMSRIKRVRVERHGGFVDDDGQVGIGADGIGLEEVGEGAEGRGDVVDAVVDWFVGGGSDVGDLGGEEGVGGRGGVVANGDEVGVGEGVEGRGDGVVAGGGSGGGDLNDDE